MGVKEIPREFLHTCDGCGVEHRKGSDSRPAHWGTLKLEQYAYDYQGAAVADGTVSMLLCSKCSDTAWEAARAAIAKAVGE